MVDLQVGNQDSTAATAATVEKVFFELRKILQDHYSIR